jgi:hypothetical protein
VSPETPTEQTDPPAVRSAPSSGKGRARLIRVAVFALVAAIAGIFVWPKVPRAQEMRLHLGIGASRVVQATARVGHAGIWDREKTWRFDHGAPSSLVWSFELPNGEADVEVELSSAQAIAQRTAHVDLRGGETSIELEPTLRSLP